jgi:lipoprotein NlpD
VVSREVGQQPRLAPKPGFVRVGHGDTIYSIAWRYGLDPGRFASWNGISAPYRIYLGDDLRVTAPPAGRGSVTTGANRVVVRKAARPAVVKKIQIRSRPKARTVTKKRTTRQKKIVYKKKLRWQWPTNGRVKVRFKRGDPSRKGIVVSGRLGQGVKAAEDGTVVYSGSGLIGYGKLLIIKHNKNYLSAYGHNKKLLVKEGDQVKKGVRIAEMGTNGSGKIVLHFEIRRNGVPVNPLPLLPRKS